MEKEEYYKVEQSENPLLTIIEDYYKKRNLVMPDEDQAFKFLVSEIGELGDALVSSDGNWVRNNPDRKRDVAEEAGDVLMMLCVTLRKRGINPITAMCQKFSEKIGADIHISMAIAVIEDMCGD